MDDDSYTKKAVQAFLTAVASSLRARPSYARSHQEALEILDVSDHIESHVGQAIEGLRKDLSEDEIRDVYELKEVFGRILARMGRFVIDADEPPDVRH